MTPVAWLHILDNTEGIEGNKPQKQLTFSEESPFGVPGVNYSQESFRSEAFRSTQFIPGRS